MMRWKKPAFKNVSLLFSVCDKIVCLSVEKQISSVFAIASFFFSVSTKKVSLH